MVIEEAWDSIVVDALCKGSRGCTSGDLHEQNLVIESILQSVYMRPAFMGLENETASKSLYGPRCRTHKTR